MRRVIVKYEKNISSCLECPFHHEYTDGNPCDMNGEYFVLKCKKLDKKIATYDRDEYLKEDFNVDIPSICPFNE